MPNNSSNPTAYYSVVVAKEVGLNNMILYDLRPPVFSLFALYTEYGAQYGEL